MQDMLRYSPKNALFRLISVSDGEELFRSLCQVDHIVLHHDLDMNQSMDNLTRQLTYDLSEFVNYLQRAVIYSDRSFKRCVCWALFRLDNRDLQLASRVVQYSNDQETINLLEIVIIPKNWPTVNEDRMGNEAWILFPLRTL